MTSVSPTSTSETSVPETNAPETSASETRQGTQGGPSPPVAAPTADVRPARRRPLWRRIARGVEFFLALVGLLALVYHGAFNFSQIQSPSMSPTLEGTNRRNGDYVLTEKISYCFRSPKRWEVIAFRSDELGLVLKRVVGLPGEKVQITKKGELVIDGIPQEFPPGMPSVRYLATANVYENRVYQCDRGYYVLGDDTQDSEDSRFTGEVPPEDIVGRAWIILAPANRRGFINP